MHFRPFSPSLCTTWKGCPPCSSLAASWASGPAALCGASWQHRADGEQKCKAQSWGLEVGSWRLGAGGWAPSLGSWHFSLRLPLTPLFQAITELSGIASASRLLWVGGKGSFFSAFDPPRHTGARKEPPSLPGAGSCGPRCGS